MNLNLKVLTWLLSAEDGLQAQPPISNHVEEVKEQFHTHEVRAGAVKSWYNKGAAITYTIRKFKFKL